MGKVFFTGSVETGRGVGEECARRLKGSVLELGGKDPMIVLADANLEHAVAGALWGGFANAGQTCSGIERVYVMREVADRFIAASSRARGRLRVGDPMGWDTEIGPMVSREQFEIVRELVDDAVAAGATLHCGGPLEAPPAPGLAGDFYAPAVLTGVTHDMRIMREEIFGPVLPIVTVDSEDEALALANDSEFGLGASVWTSDRGKGERIARELQSGMVWINDHMFSHGACQCSWGGVKESGLGRTHSKFGLYECVNVKLRVWEPSAIRNPWWHPYDETLGKALRQTAKVLYGRPSIRAAALRDGAVPLLRLGGRLAKDAVGERRARPTRSGAKRAATLRADARPGLRRQGVRLPVPQGDLRPGCVRDMLDTPFYIACLRLKGRRCLVVGGGDIGLEKVEGLLACDADVTLVAPEAHPGLARARRRGVDPLGAARI